MVNDQTPLTDTTTGIHLVAERIHVHRARRSHTTDPLHTLNPSPSSRNLFLLIARLRHFSCQRRKRIPSPTPQGGRASSVMAAGDHTPHHASWDRRERTIPTGTLTPTRHGLTLNSARHGRRQGRKFFHGANPRRIPPGLIPALYPKHIIKAKARRERLRRVEAVNAGTPTKRKVS